MKTIISRLNNSGFAWDVISFTVFMIVMLAGLNILTTAGVPLMVRAIICIPIGFVFGVVEQKYKPKEKEKPSKPARLKNTARFVLGATLSISALIVINSGGPTFGYNFGVFLVLYSAVVLGCIIAVWRNYDRA